MRGYSVKILFLLIFAVILCVYPSYTTAEIRTFSHKEEIDYGPKALPRVWTSRVYDDGTVVLRITRLKSSSPSTNTACFIELLSLRIIYPNGLVEEKDIKLDIQPFNYCVSIEYNLFLNYLDFQIIRKNQILVTYYNATDVNDHASYAEWGAIIDFDGNVKDRIFFAPAFIRSAKVENGPVVPNSEYYMNINKEKGFLRFSPVRYTLNGEWQQYDVNTDGTFRRLTSGILPFTVATSSVAINVMSTIDEGYAIVFANTTNNFTTTNPLWPQAQLFVLPIGYNQMPLEPLLLYQSSVPNLVINSLYCDISYIGIGQVCTVTAVQNTTVPQQAQPQPFYIKINFLSSGSVSSFKVLNRALPAVSSNHWVVKNLPFGGYLFNSASVDTQKNLFMYGYLFSENDDPYQWEFPEPLQTNVRAVTEVLPNNNTFMLAQKEINNSWQFLVIDLPKFTTNEDKGYSNLHVNATYPPINEVISFDTQNLSINFYDPVQLSDGRLTIYQQVDGDKSVRQFIPAALCSLENDDKTLNAKVLGSTFSVSKGNYFITMDNDFVRSRAYDEPLLGIRENVWSFTTEEVKETFAPLATGLFRLTSNGTHVFDGYSKEQQHEFFNGLLDELSLAVPVSRSRLNTAEKIQFDHTEKQLYLIAIGIKETRVEGEKSVDTVIKTLNTMVQNKDQTVIGTGQKTVFLDPLYGFIQSPDLWNKYKFRLLGVFLIIGLLIVLFLFAQRRDSKGNNIAILQLGVIIFDLVMDILFVSNNARDLPALYIPSVVFITVPIAVNTILAFYIITQEIHTAPKIHPTQEIHTTKKILTFHEWFTNHGRVASVFTVLAGADIEALNILHSNLAGFPFFNAPFSDTATSTIFWAACLNIFIEDIPQVAIQVYYKVNTVSYDIIPLLTLISSAVNLTINIIGRLYQATIRLKKNRDEPNHNDNHHNNDGDDFGGINNETILSRDIRDNKNTPEKLESHDENTSKGITKSESQQDYLGDVLKLNHEELGLGSVLSDSFNSSSNLGNDQNKNQNKGMTFLKRMVSRKE